MVVLLEVSPISTRDLRSSARVTIGFLVTSLTKALLSSIVQFGQTASSRKSFGCFKLPFKIYGGYCALGNLQCSRIVFCSLPLICASTQSCH